MTPRPLLIDTHILLWWFQNIAPIKTEIVACLEAAEADAGLAISVISLWEIALLVNSQRLTLKTNIDEWFAELSDDPRLWVIPLDRRIIIDSTRLGPTFHRDPADQLIVATARCHQLSLLTADRKILNSRVVSLAVS